MFGFATEKNPKGPSLSTRKQYEIDLSGSRIAFDMPDGNCTDIPNPAGEFKSQINIYDQGAFTVLDGTPHITLLERFFCYRAMFNPGLATLQFRVVLFKTLAGSANLFLDNLSDIITSDITHNYKKFNEEADLGVYPPRDFSTHNINNQQWLYYEIDRQSKPYPTYCHPVTRNHYLTFGFNYLSVRTREEPWYLMAKALSDAIMSSVKIELSPSARGQI
ncbi:MAG: hypothetical protein OEZ39_01695 [Gammaproteobacteria bacterium]|nr:hypothetical protein [Gammaproteobacteria bacterium]MDH5650566.1 hypothetical protein [Gammaproteobacteria bacterium]